MAGRATIAGLCALGLVVAGCGDETPDSVADETRRPLKVQHALGESKVPGRAKRPAALGASELDGSLALGVRPVAVAGPLPRYLGPRAASAARLGPADAPDLTALRRADPDVILATTPSQRPIYRRLSKIAPTVVADESVDWQSNLRHDGEGLGRTDDAEAILIDWDRRARRLRRALRGRGPFTRRELRSALPSGARPWLRRPFVAQLLDELGLPHPPPLRRDRPARDPGPYDHWSIGIGYLAALAVLEDVEQSLLRG